MGGDFPFSIWNMAVFNFVSVIWLIKFSFSSLVILSLAGFDSFSVICGFVFVLVYRLRKTFYSVLGFRNHL